MICTEPSAPPSTVIMNMAGVEDRPQSKTVKPMSVSAASTARLIRPAEMRESWPTAIFKADGVFSVRLQSQRPKPAAMAETAASVRVTGEPSVSTAMPRMSVPLLKA